MPRIDIDALYKQYKTDPGAYAELFGEALKTLVTRLVHRLYWKGLSNYKSSAISNLEDVVGQSLLEIWLRLPKYDSKRSSLNGYINLIVHSNAADAFRSYSGRSEKRFVEDAYTPPAQTHVQDKILVRELLQQLTAPEAAFARMKLDGLENAEIASALATSEGAVKSRWNRILKKMRNLS